MQFLTEHNIVFVAVCFKFFASEACTVHIRGLVSPLLGFYSTFNNSIQVRWPNLIGLSVAEPEPPFFCLEPEPTQEGRSRIRLRDLGHPGPEPPKKVAAPQHWNW